MRAEPRFIGRPQQFWGYVRIISQKLGYSSRDKIKRHNSQEVRVVLRAENIDITPEVLDDVLDYLDYRADVLEKQVQHNLMNAEEAGELFEEYLKHHTAGRYFTKLPMNKQKNEKRAQAFLTGLVNIITEITLRDLAKHHGLIYNEDLMFDDDPRKLSFVKDEHNFIQGALSRRYDGAFPSTVNPRAIWEIKEYYYTTTFGSRIADGVYETQLDGYEINDLAHLAEGDIKHIFFLDAHGTWWKMGKSYLCRIVDMLHMGLVDEVIVGREVVEYWPPVLTKIAEDHLRQIGKI